MLDRVGVRDIGRSFHHVYDKAADRDREDGCQERDSHGNREDVDGINVLGDVYTRLLW